jgi:hypothetical protein
MRSARWPLGLAPLLALVVIAPTWAYVRRPLAMPSGAQGKSPTPVPAKQEPVAAGSMSASRAVKLFTAPSGDVRAELTPGTIVQPLTREHGWMRVRIEGWVREQDFTPADSSFAASLSAADLRADPDGTRGKMVRWEMQILSLQMADPLRRDLGRDEPYLLAKGPGKENALVYLTVPPSLLAEAKTIPPLTIVIITARVRTGHSEPVGTPILELKSITRR